jgi:hypothetical protein
VAFRAQVHAPDVLEEGAEELIGGFAGRAAVEGGERALSFLHGVRVRDHIHEEVCCPSSQINVAENLLGSGVEAEVGGEVPRTASVMAHRMVKESGEDGLDREHPGHLGGVVQVEGDLLLPNLHGDPGWAAFEAGAWKLREKVTAAYYGPEPM